MTQHSQRGSSNFHEIPSPSQESRAATASLGVDRCEGMAKPAAGDASDSQHGLPASKSYSPLDGIGAIELAMAAGANARVRSAVIREILKRVSLRPDPGDTASVGLLIDAVRAANAEFSVTDYEPHGRLAKAAR